jgi:hypothetical protein
VLPVAALGSPAQRMQRRCPLRRARSADALSPESLALARRIDPGGGAPPVCHPASTCRWKVMQPVSDVRG